MEESFLATRDQDGWKRVLVPEPHPPGVSFAGRLAIADTDLWVVDGSVARYTCS
jgi:hypothetical protein